MKVSLTFTLILILGLCFGTPFPESSSSALEGETPATPNDTPATAVDPTYVNPGFFGFGFTNKL
jgi:hypothetical protein